MAIELESLKLKILRPPPIESKCIEKYLVPSPEKPFYTVCITRDQYIIWDTVSTDPVASREIPVIEERLYDVLVGDESLLDLIDAHIPLDSSEQASSELYLSIHTEVDTYTCIVR